MSRSYRKNIYDSYVCYSSKSMKQWRTKENRRLRHNAKQLLNTCLDYDALVIPVLNDYDTLWGSPQDGRKRYVPPPYLNQCLVERHESYHSRSLSSAEFSDRFWKFDGEHYTRWCTCYGNKKSRYWKLRRK